MNEDTGAAAAAAVSGDFVPTGVAGLDDILGGGLLRAGFYLLQGDPGSGKTTIALQFARACGDRGESVLYVTLSESRADLERTARSHDWSLDDIVLFDLSTAASGSAGPEPGGEAPLFHPAEVELGQTTRTILAEVERFRPRHVVFDGMGELRMLAGDAFTYRRQMLALKRYFESIGATVLALDDRTSRYGEAQPETLVGGNIVLERYVPGYGGIQRRLQVTKVRGADFRTGYHDYAIRRGGIVVFPRLVATPPAGRPAPAVFSSGVPGLDRMLDGGLSSGTTTMVMGPAGVGKSTIAMQYVTTALAAGQAAAVYTFDEVLDTLFDRSEKLCAGGGVRAYAASGLLHAQQVNPAELSPGAFSHEVRRAVEEGGARIVVIDSLNGYNSAMPEERFLQSHLHEMFAYLNQRGVATIVAVAVHGLLQTEVAQMDVSYLADTVLLLRYFEAAGEIRQAVGVFKKRTGYHERTLRELQITEGGLTVGEPLHEFRGIMTGVPQFETRREGAFRAPRPATGSTSEGHDEGR